METSLICTANQLTGFYMRATLAINGLIHTYIRLDKLYMEKLQELCKNNLTY